MIYYILLDTLLKQFTTRGHSLIVREYNNTYVRNNDQEIKFNLREILKKERNQNSKSVENQFTYASI